MPRRMLVLAASAALAAAKKPLMPKCENQADDIGVSICQAMPVSYTHLTLPTKA